MVVESIVAIVVGFAAVTLVLLVLRPEDPLRRAKVSDGAVSVDDVVLLGSGTGEVTVSGFVFVGAERVILCAARDREDPPFCGGSAVTLTGLDTSRIDLEVPDGAPAYSRDVVTVLGRYSAAVIEVSEVVQ